MHLLMPRLSRCSRCMHPLSDGAHIPDACSPLQMHAPLSRCMLPSPDACSPLQTHALLSRCMLPSPDACSPLQMHALLSRCMPPLSRCSLCIGGSTSPLQSAIWTTSPWLRTAKVGRCAAFDGVVAEVELCSLCLPATHDATSSLQPSACLQLPLATHYRVCSLLLSLATHYLPLPTPTTGHSPLVPPTLAPEF